MHTQQTNAAVIVDKALAGRQELAEPQKHPRRGKAHRVQEKDAIKARIRTLLGQCDSWGSVTPGERVTDCCTRDASVMRMANLVANNRSQAGVQLISYSGSSADSSHPSGLCHPYHACPLREIRAPIPCLIQELWYL